MTKAEIAALVLQGGAGLAGGAAQGRQNSQQNAQSQQALMDQRVQRMMAALQNAQQTGQNLQTNRQEMPQVQAQMSPLGAEQTFLQRQRMMQTLLPEMAKFNVGGPTDPGVAGAFRPPTNILANLANPSLLSAYGDQATATSLADRRKLMAQINPDYEFSSLGNFGLNPKFDQSVNNASIDAGARLKAYETAQASLANQQTQLANQQMQQSMTGNAEQKKSGGVKGFLGGVLKVAAPFASLIPGVGPIASIGIGAAGAALGSKLQGGSNMDALGSGLLGGAATGVGEGLQSLSKGQGFNPFNNAGGRVMNNSMTSASLPATFGGMPQNSQLQIPSRSTVAGMVPFAQGGQQQAPQAANSGSRMQQLLQPQAQIPQKFPSTAQPGSGLGPWANQPGYGNNNPIGQAASKATGIGADPNPQGLLSGLWQQAQQQPAVQVARSPIGQTMMGGAGLSAAGNAARGAWGSQQAFTKGAAMDQALAGMNMANQAGRTARAGDMANLGMNTMTQAGRAQRGAQTGRMIQQGLSAPNANTGINAKSIMQVLSGNNGMSPQDKAAFLARPETQAILQSLMGVR